MIFQIQEGFTLNLSLEILSLCRDDEAVRFHVDEIDDVISALERAKQMIQAEEIRANEKEALARWGKERIPTSEKILMVEWEPVFVREDGDE